MPKIQKKSDWTNLLTQKTKEFLERLGCKVWRQNNLSSPGRTFNGEEGIGDLIGVTQNGIYIEVEVKTKGDRLSDEQIRHGKTILAHGGIYIVVRDYQSWESLKEIFKATNGQKRIPKTNRTEKEIREYVERECQKVLSKEKEWLEFSEARYQERKDKERFKRQIKKALKEKGEEEGKSGSLPKLNKENPQRSKVRKRPVF